MLAPPPILSHIAIENSERLNLLIATLDAWILENFQR